MMGETITAEEKLSTAAAYSSKFPGFKFAPTDKELICCYLKSKLEGRGYDYSVQLIPEINITRHEPWDLPSRSIIRSENEWFFFYARGKKYPRESQSKRMTQLGYWKSTGRESDMRSDATVIRTKRTLVFHRGRAPKGKRTEWMMHEYSMYGQSRNSPVICRLRRTSKFHSNESGEGASVSVYDSDDVVSGHNNLGGSSSQNFERYEAGFGSDQKPTSEEGTMAEPPLVHNQKDSEDDDLEDFCRDILRDDILGSGECSIFDNPDTKLALSNSTRDEDPMPMQASWSHPLPFQGTASRRIRLKKHKPETNNSEPSKYFAKILLSHCRRVDQYWLILIMSAIVVFLLMLFFFLIKKLL